MSDIEQLEKDYEDLSNRFAQFRQESAMLRQMYDDTLIQLKKAIATIRVYEETLNARLDS